jgi:mannose-1-phosphate guanylyltransferase
MTDPVAVVFAGGRGTRLWPLSRQAAPKQFQPLAGRQSLTATTIARLERLVAPERILVSTTVEFAGAARACLGPVPAGNLVVEQGAKGPATALALALTTVAHRFGDAPLLTCPSDHVFTLEDNFARGVARMLDQVTATPDSVVVLGAQPTRPDPSLGYMLAEPSGIEGVHRVVEQVEKPDRAVAADLMARGSVFWNTMCYAVDSRHALGVYRRRRPDVVAAVESYVGSNRTDGYAGPPAAGLELEPFFEDGMELLMVTEELGWSDIGTWSRLEGFLEPEESPALGTSYLSDSSDVLIASMDGRPVVALGVKDLVIVTHADAVYVLDKKKADDVVALEQLRAMLGETRKDLL